MKVLVTGSMGLVGSASVELFEYKGWDVIGIDNNGRSKFFGTPPKQNSGNQIDIRNEDAVDHLFALHKFDAIIHAAAQPSHDYATDHVLEDFDINARGTVILLEATRTYCPEAVFVYVSTDKVYGENMDTGFNLEKYETDTRYNPPSKGFTEDLGLDFAGDRSFFGCSKAAADMYAQQYAARGMKVGIFRPGCITGKNHAGAEQHGFLAYLTKCIKDEKVYKIFGFKGKQVRDQIHANDLASAFFAFIEKPRVGAVYNMGGGPERSVSVLEAIKLIETKTGKTAYIRYEDSRKGDRQWDVHDVSKFRGDYPDWQYKYSLSDIIKDLCTE